MLSIVVVNLKVDFVPLPCFFLLINLNQTPYMISFLSFSFQNVFFCHETSDLAMKPQTFIVLWRVMCHLVNVIYIYIQGVCTYVCISVLRHFSSEVLALIHTVIWKRHWLAYVHYVTACPISWMACCIWDLGKTEPVISVASEPDCLFSNCQKLGFTRTKWQFLLSACSPSSCMALMQVKIMPNFKAKWSGSINFNETGDVCISLTRAQGEYFIWITYFWPLTVVQKERYHYDI